MRIGFKLNKEGYGSLSTGVCESLQEAATRYRGLQYHGYAVIPYALHADAVTGVKANTEYWLNSEGVLEPKP